MSVTESKIPKERGERSSCEKKRRKAESQAEKEKRSAQAEEWRHKYQGHESH